VSWRLAGKNILLDKSFANMMRFQEIGTKLFPRLRSEKEAPAGQQRQRASDGTCFRFQYNIISLMLGGSGFPAAIKWIYSDFLSWLESHSHEQLVLSY
jgi:hypothetical protein